MRCAPLALISAAGRQSGATMTKRAAWTLASVREDAVQRCAGLIFVFQGATFSSIHAFRNACSIVAVLESAW